MSKRRQFKRDAWKWKRTALEKKRQAASSQAASTLPARVIQQDEVLIKNLGKEVTEEFLRQALVCLDYQVANVLLMATAKPTPVAYVRFVEPASAQRAAQDSPAGLNGYRPDIYSTNEWVVTLQID